MSMNIPLPDAPDVALNKGFGQATDLYNMLIKHAFARAQNRRAEEMQPIDIKHKLAQISNAGAANSRAQAMQQYRIQALKDAHEKYLRDSNPNKKIEDLQRINDYFDSLDKEQGSNMDLKINPTSHEDMPSYIPSIKNNNSEEGLIEQGNIDLNNRPLVNNPQTGGKSTVWSMGIGTPKGETLIPRISDDGRILSTKEAIDQFHRTGKHLGVYKSQEHANNAAESLHKEQAQQYLGEQEPKLNENQVDEFTANELNKNQPQIQNKKSNNKFGGLSKEYLRTAMTAKTLGIPVPKMSNENQLDNFGKALKAYKDIYAEHGPNHEFTQWARKNVENVANHLGKSGTQETPEQKQERMINTALAIAKGKAEITPKETPEQKTAREIDKAIKIDDAKTKHKEDTKIINQLQDSELKGHDLEQSYNSLEEAFKNPLWNKIHTGFLTKGGDKGRKFQLAAVRNYGTKEEKALLAKVESTSNELVSKMASVFKGPFRVAEQSLIENVKPQAYDTPEAARSKLVALQQALAKQQYINHRIPELIRNEELNATEAFGKAFKEVGGKEFQESLKRRFESDSDKFKTVKKNIKDMTDEELQEIISKGE